MDITKLSENASISALGYVNNYVVNITKKYIIDEPHQIKRRESLTDVFKMTNHSDVSDYLVSQINYNKQLIGDGTNGNAQRLVINTLLLEKLKDREDLQRNQRHKLILSICVIIVPLISNLLQFTWNYFTRRSDSC